MRTSNMIYQAAVAHQAELRRTAAGRSLKADASEGRAAARLFARVASRRARPGAAAQPAAIGMPSVSV